MPLVKIHIGAGLSKFGSAPASVQCTIHIYGALRAMLMRALHPRRTALHSLRMLQMNRVIEEVSLATGSLQCPHTCLTNDIALLLLHLFSRVWFHFKDNHNYNLLLSI